MQSILDIMKLYIESVKEALTYDNTIRIVNKKKEPIFAGPIVNSNYFDDSILNLYNLATEKGINPGYPLGAVTYIDTSCNDFAIKISKYYFRMEKYNNEYKSEGKYVVLYGKCSYGKPKVLYEKLFSFIKENNLITLGNIYEEYSINEISTLNEEDYCMKLEVRIK